MIASDTMLQCLADLDRRLDDQQEQANAAGWMAFLNDECPDDIFTPPPRVPAPASVEWPRIRTNRTLDDVDKMLLSQLGTCSHVLASGGGQRLCVRCNYGTGIISSLFGCEVFVMPDETGTLPTTRPLGDADKARALLDAGVPDLRGSLGGKVFECAERFLEVFEAYPAIRRHVNLYHPDTQGPMDLAELVWGSDIFYAFHEDQQLLRDVLDLITETYIAFMRAWFEMVPPDPVANNHWGVMHKGVLMVRNDSLMNLSPEAYVQYVRPMDQRVFDEFGGGAMHFCGRGEHYIEAMSEMRGLTGVNMSQPELNDMETIYRNTVDKKIKLLSFRREAAEQANRPLRGQVHCR